VEEGAERGELVTLEKRTVYSSGDATVERVATADGWRIRISARYETVNLTPEEATDIEEGIYALRNEGKH